MKKSPKNNDKPFKKFYKDDKKRHSPKPRKEEKVFMKRNSSQEAEEKKFVKKKPGGARMGSGRFEEEDLSFGRKKKTLRPVVQETQQPEVTFSKELKNKWKPETPPTASFKSKNRKSADRPVKRHEHPAKKKGFERYFGKDANENKAYDAKRSPGKNGKEEVMQKETFSDLMPLNKYIAYCDICGRREAALLVKEGKVKVNGELITEPGHKVTPEDQVTLSGKKLQLQQNRIYILLNKPKGFITTTDDPKGRRTVMDLFREHVEERIFPIGRLDRNTTGLLLLTNDGSLAQRLAHPSYEIRKVYQVTLNKALAEKDFEKIKEGVVLEDGPAPVDQLSFLDSKQELGLEIHNGKNRIVRRIFESLGYTVEKLDRVMYAGLTKKNVPRGKWRFLNKQEIINLKHLNS